MIVFGTYAFPIQTLDSARYGLPAGAKLQLYCKVFHLFWIPFFPTGRTWVLKMNGEKYEPAHQIKQMIERNEHKKSVPFYSFAIPLLLLIGYPTMLGMNALEDNRRQKEHVERETTKRQGLLAQIDIPEQGDVFLFNHLVTGEQHYKKKSSAVIVEAVSRDSILLRVPPSSESLSDYNALRYFGDNQKPVEYSWVAKTDLKATINLDNFEYRTFQGVVVPGLFPNREINLTGSQKSTTQQWQTMDHPEGPLSRFRKSK